MKKIQGRYIAGDGKEAQYGEWTVKEIANFVKDNHFAHLSLSGYHINDENQYASALTLFPGETIPTQEGDRILIPACFRRFKLGYMLSEGNPDDLIPVTCIVNANDERLFVTISKN
ncbi:hypothetical protein [Bacillus thuringiensis]|uniref:hypothetical protein n=1 Tax=Bacillus thuringiensis TaxID=1428 RepID=UPI0021D66D03|nr:hypothetical protein [Bacillus thuringiensis]MCU7667534.1 hypothetical protein [Bacillus thuringiensis]